MGEWKQIDSFTEPELRMYAGISEVQLKHYFEPAEGIFIAESPKVIERALNAGYEPLSFLLEEGEASGEAGEVIRAAAEKSSAAAAAPVYLASPELMRTITGYPMTRGMLAAFQRRKLPDVRELLAGKERVAVLEAVMNPTNIGAIFRSAAALGMDAVLLTQGSSDPLYRRAARVSMGTVFQIPWTMFPDTEAPEDIVRILRECGFKTAAMALKPDSYDIDDPALSAEKKLAVVLGTEGDGLKTETIADCDYTVCIPMDHGVDSLNVAAASAVAFWQLGRKAKKERSR